MRVAFLVKDLGPSQLSYLLIKKLNESLASGALEDAAVFYEELARPCLEPRFGCMHLAEGWDYGGVAVATTLSTARKLAGFPSAAAKFFYVWDLEWVRAPAAHSELRAVYRDPSLRLLARSAEHAGIVRSCWGRHAGVCEDFDFSCLS